MNAIPATELKRHGISAVERILQGGPVHIIKHNQPVCVILSEADYQQLIRSAAAAKPLLSRPIGEIPAASTR